MSRIQRSGVFSVNDANLVRLVVGKHASAIDSDHVRIVKSGYGILLVFQRGLAMIAFGIVARAEFPAARTVRQGGSDFVQKLWRFGLPDQILIAGSVDHVGTTVAIKVRKAFAHAT